MNNEEWKKSQFLFDYTEMNVNESRARNTTLTCGHGILRFLRFIFFRGERVELELLDELLVEPVDTEEDERCRF